jgi:hypothetical protein
MIEAMAARPSGAEARRYFRRWVRNEVDLPAKVEILTTAGKKVNGGSAVIRDVSLRGALLTSIKLKKSVLPAASFQVRLTFSSDKYKGIGALCRPIRFGRGSDFELAVEFVDFWARTGPK